MARVVLVQRFAIPLPLLFEFFRRPANIIQVAPPDLGLQLLDAPERLELGSRVTVQVTRWGFTRQIINEVIELVDDQIIVEEQRKGPLPTWRHSQKFALDGEETSVTVEIDFQTPGGMLGFFVTPAAVEADLRRAYAYREEKVKTLLKKA
jgi:ligand-binding SRPBCC domain-containing protein